MLKKYRKVYGVILIIGTLILMMGSLVLMKIIHPNHFFIQPYEVRGVDVSHYQGEIDWKTIETQDIDFAIIKATEGSSHIDEQFAINWENAHQTDLYLGAYHFFSFDSEGKTQAEHYINVVGDLKGKIIPIVDVEYYGDKEKNPPKEEDVQRQLQIFLTILEEHYGVKPMIYSTYKVYHKYIKGTFNDYPLWIRNVYYTPNIDIRQEWTLWQYSDTTLLEGYKGKEKYIDMNVFNGDMETFNKILCD